MVSHQVKRVFILTLAGYIIGGADCFSQVVAGREAGDFPEMIFTRIPGAPKLKPPVLITNGTTPIVGGGVGYAAPAFYDWDGDEVKDLLIGEFASGAEYGKFMGSFIRVYLNTGSDTAPRFTGDYDYARPPFEYKSDAHGTPYSVDQYCCVGFTPQFADLNEDGFLDMVTGQYQGEVTWFKGSEEGFHAGVELPQSGNPRGDDWMRSQDYWLYSSASFGDFTNDGRLDLIVGGKALRLSVNSGGLENPQFSRRELLKDTQGNPLKVYNYSEQDLAEIAKLQVVKPCEAGDYATSPFVIDWDRDGVLDLLVTNSYAHEGLSVVDFFKGVYKEGRYQFEPGIALFKAKKGGKVFPGSSPFVFVTDWNSDGIDDLLIGVTVVTIRNSFSDLSWKWAKEVGVTAGKGPAVIKRLFDDATFRRILASQTPPEGLTAEDFLTMDHVGYVYIMLGM